MNQIQQIPGTAKVDINVGQPCYYDDATGGWRLAVNDSALHAASRGVALNSVKAGATLNVAPVGSVLPKSVFKDSAGNSLFAAVTTQKAYVAAVAGTYGDVSAVQGKYNYLACVILGNYVLVADEGPPVVV